MDDASLEAGGFQFSAGLMEKTNLIKFYKKANGKSTHYILDDFHKNQIVKCDLFKCFMRVMDIDRDLNQVFIYKIDELSDIYTLEPSQLRLTDANEEIVELLYM